jgi:steroid delta-isomerase-like uncharacterized protein
MSDDQHITHLVESFYADAWNRWDDASVELLLADDFVFRGSLRDGARGRDGFRAYRDKVRAAFPDFHNEVRELICDGRRAAVRLLCTGRHTGELLGFAPTGLTVAYDAAAFFHSRDDQLSEAWVLGDLDALRTQISASKRPDRHHPAEPQS